MDTFAPGIDSYYPAAPTQFFNYLIRKAERYFHGEEAEKSALDSPAKIRRHAEKMRKFFLGMMGGIPRDDSRLDPRVTGVVEAPTFRVEKVIFNSLKDYPVTANLYIPAAAARGRVPAVLLCCGHSPEGKAYPSYVRMARMLAKNGFVVLCFDPAGQGERLQLIDRKTGSQVVRLTTIEHSYVGLACTLLGQNICRYFIRDGMRAVDYLRSRPEVDTTRIAVTGTSGGGTQTCLLMLADPRFAAAAPSCYVTERLSYMKTFHAHDAEQNFHGHIPARFNYSDFLIAFAPKPVFLAGVDSDFFPIDGLMKTFRTCTQIYKTLKAETDCRLVVDKSVHNFSLPNRQAVTAFFAEKLAGKKRSELDLAEEPLFTPEQLQCTASGQILMDRPKVPNLMERVTREIPRKSQRTGSALRSHVRKLVYHDRLLFPLYPRVIGTHVNSQRYYIEKIFFYTEADLLLTSVLVRPEAATGRLPATVVVLPRGTDTLHDDFVMTDLRDRWRGGKWLLFLDVRGIGGVKPFENDGIANPIYGTQFKFASNAWMLGDNLACMRAYDILRGVQLLRSRPDVDPDRVSIYGRDEMAFPALLAAVADGNIQAPTFEGLPRSYAAAMREIYYDRQIINEASVVNGMLAQFDVADLLKLV